MIGRRRHRRGGPIGFPESRSGVVQIDSIRIEPGFCGARLIQGPLSEDAALQAIRRLGIAPMEPAELRSEQDEAAREHMPRLAQSSLFLVSEFRPSGEICDEWVRVVAGPRWPASFDRRPDVEPMSWRELVDIYGDVIRGGSFGGTFSSWIFTI